METKKLYRSRTDKMVAGVCGGLGKYLGIDPTLIRLAFALLVLFGIGSGLLIYLVMMIVMPLEPEALADIRPPSEN
jgi:phage shock protein PspC (stress-responsive transcriptional regulator)